LVSASRAQKKACGGGNAAIEPPLISATATRLAARSGTGFWFGAPPKAYSCQLLAMSRQTIFAAGWIARPVSPVSYL
jgi:hypothetical protein